MKHLLPLLLLVLLVGCVPGVVLTDAPCPCGDGWTCCETLAVCLPNETLEASCPSTLPPSSDTPCASDADCNPTEACASWRIGEANFGPQVCKKTCNENACNDDERCLFSLHDGVDSEQLQLAKLCLPKEPPEECASWICEGCPGLALGQVTTCDAGASDITACVFALHPDCGLKCELAMVGACVGIAPNCMEYACDACPGGAPGVIACENSRMVTCLGAGPGGKDPCDLLCTKVEIGSCE